MDVCFCFRRMTMRKLIYPRGKIFRIVGIHFGKRDTFSQKWFYIMKHEKMCNGFEILKEFERAKKQEKLYKNEADKVAG